MSRSRRQFLVAAASILALALIGLFLADKALLVWGSAPGGGAQVGMLRCTYFTGTGLTERKFLYSESGVLGRDHCPRWVDL